MIRVLQVEQGRCRVEETAPEELHVNDGVHWIDLLDPSTDEEHLVEAKLALDVPTRAEMREIETSSRLYRQGEATFMTATVIAHADTPEPVSAAVTFVLTPRALLTVRYADPLPFQTFTARARRSPELCAGPEATLANLLDAVVDRSADILEGVADQLEKLSRAIFAKDVEEKDFEAKLGLLGKNGDVISRVRESLVSLSRLLLFAMQSAQIRDHAEAREMLAVVSDDIGALNEHVAFLSNKITFLLDATLGMINIEQNTIIKFFSVVAVLFLPPTLIASIYGMNFAHMPELKWGFAYPAALGAMLLSMVGSYVYFKWKKWV